MKKLLTVFFMLLSTLTSSLSFSWFTNAQAAELETEEIISTEEDTTEGIDTSQEDTEESSDSDDSDNESL